MRSSPICPIAKRPSPKAGPSRSGIGQPSSCLRSPVSSPSGVCGAGKEWRKKDPNGQGQMTKEISIAKAESRIAWLLGDSPCVFLSDFVIRHSSFLFMLAALFAAVFTKAAEPVDRPTVLVVVGAPGEAGYGTNFSRWAGLWEKASRDGGAKFVCLGLGETKETTTDLEQLKTTLALEARESAGELWLVLIGHGTFDGKEAKFNLRGPD